MQSHPQRGGRAGKGLHRRFERQHVTPRAQPEQAITIVWMAVPSGSRRDDLRCVTQVEIASEKLTKTRTLMSNRRVNRGYRLAI
jgi:hypothetical protein